MHKRHRAALVTIVALLSVGSSDIHSQGQWQKDLANPVLAIGAPGSWDDAIAGVNAVIFDAGQYKMWYDGNSGIGYATSPDGLSWTKHATNPVLTPGPPGAWDAVQPGASSVLLANSTFHMWYSATDTIGKNRIGHATSPDGIVWTKDPANPVLDLGPDGSWDDSEVMHPTVLFKDNTFHMWYNGHHEETRILYASSSDGTDWMRFTDRPVLDLGPPGAWDDEGLLGMCVLYVDNAYHMWYTGANVLWRIGHAISPDGLTWWKDSLHNPVLEPGGFVGGFESWDYPLVGFPCVMFDGSQYKMWYMGGDFDQLQTGYATSDPVTSSADDGAPGLLSYRLEQNHPNPFNPETAIRFHLESQQRVSLMIYDVKGRMVRALVRDELQAAGPQEVPWDGRDEKGRSVASGVYFYRLEAGPFARTKQMTLIK